MSLLCFAVPAAAQTAPSGWKVSHPTPRITLLTPPDLKPGEVFTAAVYAMQPLHGRSVAAWLPGGIGSDPIRPGTPYKTPQLEKKTINAEQGLQPYQTSSGLWLMGVYSSYTLDNRSVRLIRMLASSDKLPARYRPGLDVIMDSTIAADQKATQAEIRTLRTGRAGKK